MSSFAHKNAKNSDNPFSYGTIVVGNQFAGRERDIGELHIALLSGKSVVLHSAKMMGKSSLIAEFARRYSKEFEFLVVRLKGISDECEFAELLAKETLRTGFSDTTELNQEIKELLGTMKLMHTMLEGGWLGVIGKPSLGESPRTTSENDARIAKSRPTIESQEPRTCKTCGMPLKWIAKYKRHYCYGCKAYAPRLRTSRTAKGAREGQEGTRTCLDCGTRLTYDDRYREYFCNRCRVYPFVEQGLMRSKGITSEEVVEAFELVEKVAEHIGTGFVVVLDDFEEVTSFESERLLTVIRNMVARQKNVRYVFSGSNWPVLGRLFERKGSPLYRLAHPIDLREIPRDELSQFLVRRFASSGGKLSDSAASRIVSTCGCHPYYSQLIAHELFHISKEPTETDVETALQLAIKRHSLAYSYIWESLRSPLQRRYMLGVALEPGVAHGSRFITRHLLKSRSHVQRVEKQLRAKGILDSGGISDPLFLLWLRDLASCKVLFNA